MSTRREFSSSSEPLDLNEPASLALLQEMAQKAAQAQTIEIKDFLGREFLAIAINGTIQPIKMERAPIADYAHKVRTLQDIAQIAKDCADPKNLQVWIGQEAVILTFDRNLRNRATCPLVFSETFVSIRNLKSGALTQEQLISLLRIDLAGCQAQCPELLPSIRHLNFSARGQSTSEQDFGSAKLGKAMEIELIGADKVPETVVLTSDVYEEFGVSVGIRCTMDIQLQAERIRMVPQPREISMALTTARLAIREALEMLLPSEQHSRILFGTP
jgi:hypothetical protein